MSCHEIGRQRFWTWRSKGTCSRYCRISPAKSTARPNIPPGTLVAQTACSFDLACFFRISRSARYHLIIATYTASVPTNVLVSLNRNSSRIGALKTQRSSQATVLVSVSRRRFTCSDRETISTQTKTWNFRLQNCLVISSISLAWTEDFRFHIKNINICRQRADQPDVGEDKEVGQFCFGPEGAVVEFHRPFGNHEFGRTESGTRV